MAEIPDRVREEFPDINMLIVHYQDCDTMGKCVVETPMEMYTLSSIFKRTVKDHYWELRYDPDRNVLLDYRHKQFIDFIRDPYPRGLGTDVATLRKLLDAEAVVLLESVIPREQGGNNNPEGRNQHTKDEIGEPEEAIFGAATNRPNVRPTVEVNRDNVTVDLATALPEPQRGNSREFAIRKLKRYRPDLLAKVSSGELSCHAAMKAAGFRRDPTPLQMIMRLLPKLDAADRLLLAHELSQLCQPERNSQ